MPCASLQFHKLTCPVLPCSSFTDFICLDSLGESSAPQIHHTSHSQLPPDPAVHRRASNCAHSDCYSFSTVLVRPQHHVLPMIVTLGLVWSCNLLLAIVVLDVLLHHTTFGCSQVLCFCQSALQWSLLLLCARQVPFSSS